MIAIFILSGLLSIVGITAVVNALCKDAYQTGYREGHQRGTFDACKQQVDTEAFFRGLGHSDKTQFPHR